MTAKDEASCPARLFCDFVCSGKRVREAFRDELRPGDDGADHYAESAQFDDPSGFLRRIDISLRNDPMSDGSDDFPQNLKVIGLDSVLLALLRIAHQSRPDEVKAQRVCMEGLLYRGAVRHPQLVRILLLELPEEIVQGDSAGPDGVSGVQGYDFRPHLHELLYFLQGGRYVYFAVRVIPLYDADNGKIDL